MKKRIKKDDLLGRYYDITTRSGRQLRFRGERIMGEGDTIIVGHDEEYEGKVLRFSQIARIFRRGVECELEGPEVIGLAEWQQQAQERDREAGTTIARQVMDRLGDAE